MRTAKPVEAVLRAAVEGLELGTYFGSWGALDYHIECTVEEGLIEAVTHRPTPAGNARYEEANLGEKPKGRWYFWEIES